MEELGDDGADGQQVDEAPSTQHRTAHSRSALSDRRKARTRLKIACDTCRARRTKCDGKRPSCTHCHTRGSECHYQHVAVTPLSSGQVELAAINKRLDHLTSLLTTSSSAAVITAEPRESTANDSASVNQDDSPFKLLGRGSMMDALGLDADFAEQLLTLERSAQQSSGNSPRFFIIQHEQAVSALAAFSEQVHVWYPILRPGFSEQYLGVISGSLAPSPESCLVLLVAALGSMAQTAMIGGSRNDAGDTPYFEAALASLPAIISDCSVTSVQCLVLFSIYYCCLMKPCQAHDYALIASFKVQNLLKRPESAHAEVREHIRRVYWAILLLESELSVQFDVAKSGIWALDEIMTLPDGRRTWQFSVEAGSPLASTTSPASMPPTPSASTDKVQSYFLAEIAMRRMLHRCNTAVRKTPSGKWIYAPAIATELELQLDEWYSYLPIMIRFSTSLNGRDTENLRACPLTNFLRVQYFCCKISIYWPALYQAVQDGHATGQLLNHCRRFFDSYVQLMPSIVIATENCLVNRWTLLASIFMTSMATIKAMETPCLSELCTPELAQCVSSTLQVNQDVIRQSPSLKKMFETLYQRMSNDYDIRR